MAGENLLSMDHMTAVLDNAPVAVYVSEIESCELLYANRMAKELFLNLDLYGSTCYQVAGFDKPCPFCRAEKLSKTELWVREFQHPINKNIYQLSGKIIDWAGQPAHVEYIKDITEEKKEEEQAEELKDRLQATFSSIPCGLSVYHFDGAKISPLFHNPAFYEIMGYSEEHVLSTQKETSFLGVHPDDLNLLKEKIQKILMKDGLLQHTYRVWNDKREEYRWIRLDGSSKSNKAGMKILYGVYSDVSEQKQLEKELTNANDKMQDIINAIPGGVAIYKSASDIFETVYFSDGVPEISGYSLEEYEELAKDDAAKLTYWEDKDLVIAKAREVIQSRGVASFEFRKQHRDGQIVWVHVQMKWIGEADGCPLIHCVFHNISDFKEARLEMDYLVNSIPGGIASFRIQGNKPSPIFFSDGVRTLSGHTREEYRTLYQDDIFNVIYEPDRERVLTAIQAAFESGETLEISYRMHHKDGNLIWIHLNGRRIGPTSDARFYAVFTGLSAEARLFQSMVNETEDGIYVIDQRNYDLLYANESRNSITRQTNCLGRKCYEALFHKEQPCEFCTLDADRADGEEHEMVVAETGRYYKTRFRQLDWNGIPAYVKLVRDVTEEVQTNLEKERLEIYFRTMVERMPGGICVICCQQDGSMSLEFISDGLASMIHMTVEEIENQYQNDIFQGFHADDAASVKEQVMQFIGRKESCCELTGRLNRGDGSHIWVKITISLLQMTDGMCRLYTVFTDISKTIEEKEQLRRQYEELIFQHHSAPGPNALIVGHCNITQNKILEINDFTDSNLLDTFGTCRQDFFRGIANLIVDEKEQQLFLNTYLNEPALAAFARNDTEQILDCFIKLPKDARGRYVQFKVIMVETPYSGDITGILTVTDITDQVVSDRILHQLSGTSHDVIMDFDLDQDNYTVLSCNEEACYGLDSEGALSQRVDFMVESAVVPKDREQYAKGLDPDRMRKRLTEEGFYTFAFSITDEKGDIRTKNMTISAIDLRLGRVCLMCTDITDSIREQQSLLNMAAYTFELMGRINIYDARFTMYTREVVLDNLAPSVFDNYNDSLNYFIGAYISDEGIEGVRKQFLFETMLEKLEQEPAGYDFVLPYQAKSDKSLRYKQISVLWGDQNHQTICIVRADVTDMMTAERQAKEELKAALDLAEEANLAKSDFLSAMSHDIRTPMNAIIGMTALATAHLKDVHRVEDCLQKITVASRHLLSLINDVLDMSRIERSKITLNHIETSLPELISQISAIIEPSAIEAGLQFNIRTENLEHETFYGDSLRISQILINILSNAVKFTPEGGSVDFLVEEIQPVNEGGQVRYRFTVSDTGIGMPEEFITNIFAPFARSCSAARIEGTGLGLSITKGLVDLMQGEISVYSEVDKGSIFHVELECRAAKKTVHSKKLKDGFTSFERSKSFAECCFLIAEDNDINAEILSELLLMYGAKSVIKTDGAQAAEEFRHAEPGTYDAILMDIQMPEMNGYEATRIIRSMERPDAATIPIIAMTANAFSEDIQASVEAGMNAHVSKPIDMDVLRVTLSNVLSI